MSKEQNKLPEDSKILKILQSFDRAEWKEFGCYVKSPIFNTNNELVCMYVALTKKYPFRKAVYRTDLLEATGKREPNANPNSLSDKERNILNKQMTSFTNLAFGFLGYLESKRYPTYNQRLTVSALMRKQLYDYVPSIIQKQEIQHLSKGNVNTRYLQDLYLLREPLLFLDIIQQNRTISGRLQHTMDEFWHYSLSNLLRLYCSAAGRERILNIKYQYPLDMENLLNHIEQQPNAYPPLVKGYYLILRLLILEQETSAYQQLVLLMQTFATTFSVDVQREFYSHMLNFCSREIRKGKLAYQIEKHSIYQSTLPLNIWNTGIHFSAHHYILLVKNALDVGAQEQEWVFQFIEKYQDKLAPRHQTTIPLLARAHYHYFQQQYDEALSYLSQVSDEEDFFYTLYFKSLLIKINYEDNTVDILSDKHPLPYALESLRAYLSRNKKMSETIKTSYQNFMKLTKRLFRIRQQPAHKENRAMLLNRLLKDTQSEELLDERNWLLQKIEELQTIIKNK